MKYSSAIWVLGIFGASVYGQTDRAAVGGLVSDPSGANVDAAVVYVSFPATGYRRQTVSNAKGEFALHGLPPGHAEVRIEKDGFQPILFPDVTLSAGSNVRLAAKLELAQGSTALEVRADAALLQQSSAELGTAISGKQISGIPVNGRNWQGLLALSPGAINTGIGDARGVRFTGHGVDDNNLRIDGVDATGIRNQVPRDDVRLAISLDSIAEFRVSSALYTAETGGTMAAQVNIVSRSGTNSFHGQVFEYLRNNRLDARSPFDPARLPPFRLNQFGANAAGPLRRDRTLFFANYEGLEQRRLQTLTAFVPSAAFRSRITSAQPVLSPLVSAYPAGTSNTADVNIDRWTGAGRLNNSQHSGAIRLDHRFANGASAFARFNSDAMEVRSPQGDGTGFMGAANRVSQSIHNGVLQFQNSLNPASLHELRLGVNRVAFLSRFDAAILPALRVAGLTSIPGGRQSLVNATTFTLADQLTLLRGRHTLKAGVQIRPIRIALRTVADGSALTYSNLADFAANRINAANITGFLGTRGIYKTSYSGFLLDEIRVLPNLALNAGLRYEFFGVFQERTGRAKPFNLETCGGYCPAGSAFTEPATRNFAPRLSLAWTPGGASGRTVLRGGFGIYHGEGQLGNQQSPVENETIRISLSGAALNGVANPLDLFNPAPGAASTSPLDLQRRRKDMYTVQWGGSLQRLLPGGSVAEVTYLGSRGRQLFVRSYLNLVDPRTGVRQLPQFDLIPLRANGGNSSYHGMNISWRRANSFTRGLFFTANYLWSHAIDEFSAGGDDAGYPQNVSCRRCDRASSDFDVRQASSFSAAYEIPLPARAPALSRAILGGWQASGMMLLRSGRPVTVTVSRRAADLPDRNITSAQRPDVVAGVSPLSATRSTQSWINAAAFSVPSEGRWGNAGRNLVRAPGQWNLDAALAKRVPLGERFLLDFRAEFFNLFNHPQFGLPLANISSPATFGTITQLVNTGATGIGTPRQIQFALRLGF